MVASSRRSPLRRLVRPRSAGDHVPAWISAGRAAMADAKVRRRMWASGEGVGMSISAASSFSSAWARSTGVADAGAATPTSCISAPGWIVSGGEENSGAGL